MHVPAWHVSTWVQALRSLQGVPFRFAIGGEQTPVVGAHVPAS